MMRELIAGGLMVGTGAMVLAQQPAPVPVPIRELTPVVTSVVITAPYGQPPEIRITVSSPYAGAKVTTESTMTGDHFPPKGPQPVPVPVPAPAPERRPYATIGEPASGFGPAPAPAPAPRAAPIEAKATKPATTLSPAARAAQVEAPYRRIPGR